jgi:hypothetical protein
MPEKATFLSKHRNLRLVRQAQEEVPMPNGTFHVTKKPVRYEFAPDGRLDVEEGQDVLFDGPPEVDPETGELKRDEYNRPIPTAQDAISWLRNHGLYNRVGVIGAFTEEGREPNRIPDAGPTVREIMAAMVQMDVDTLARIAAEEQAATWTRPAVDAALEEAFAQVQGAQAAMEARQQELGQQGDGDPAVTPENGGKDPLEGVDLDLIDSMKELQALGQPFGLSFPPGTSKSLARDQIRAAHAEMVGAAA